MSKVEKRNQKECKKGMRIPGIFIVVFAVFVYIAFLLQFVLPRLMASPDPSYLFAGTELYVSLMLLGSVFLIFVQYCREVTGDAKPRNADTSESALDQFIATAFDRVKSQKWSFGLIAAFVCLSFALIGLFWV